MDYKYGNEVLAPRVLERLFEKIDKYEQRVGKDCSEFSSKEALAYFTLNNDRSLSVITNKYSILSDYADWCLNNGLLRDGKNHYLEINMDALKKCVNKEKMKKSILTRREVLDGIENLQNPRDKFIILAIFEIGVKRHFEDIRNIKLSDFDDNNKLNLGNRTVTVTDKLHQLAKEADGVMEYIYTNQKVYTLIDSEYVVKYVANIRSGDSDEGKKLMMIIRRLLIYLGWDNIIPRDLALSGMLHMIRAYAKYYKVQPVTVVKDKRIYKKICDQYDVKTYYTVFLNQYGALLTSE